MFEELSFRTAERLFKGSMIVLAFQALILFPTGFAPGWANGWPGVSKHTVFAGFMSAMLMVALLAVATGSIAMLCAGVEQAAGKKYAGWLLFLVLMILILLINVYICSIVYPSLRASIAEEWP